MQHHVLNFTNVLLKELFKKESEYEKSSLLHIYKSVTCIIIIIAFSEIYIVNTLNMGLIACTLLQWCAYIFTGYFVPSTIAFNKMANSIYDPQRLRVFHKFL